MRANKQQAGRLCPGGFRQRRGLHHSGRWDAAAPPDEQNPGNGAKHPSWSPAGKKIAFYSNRETGRRQIWLMDHDGMDRHILGQDAYNDWDPVWIK
jgi:hypothetical protein